MRSTKSQLQMIPSLWSQVQEAIDAPMPDPSSPQTAKVSWTHWSIPHGAWSWNAQTQHIDIWNLQPFLCRHSLHSGTDPPTSTSRAAQARYKPASAYKTIVDEKTASVDTGTVRWEPTQVHVQQGHLGDFQRQLLTSSSLSFSQLASLLEIRDDDWPTRLLLDECVRARRQSGSVESIFSDQSLSTASLDDPWRQMMTLAQTPMDLQTQVLRRNPEQQDAQWILQHRGCCSGWKSMSLLVQCASQWKPQSSVSDLSKSSDPSETHKQDGPSETRTI